MQITINNLKTDYLKIGAGPTLVFLHGWSKDINKERYQKLFDSLSQKYQLIALDLPGFGQTDSPQKPWSVSDYAKFVNEFLDKLNISNCIMAGHSFGGRITLKLASQNNPKIKKIILIDSAGIERKSLKVKLLSSVSGIIPVSVKKILIPILGSKDYNDVNGVLRETFKLVVNENLEPIIPKIKVPTLLVWGKEDHTTPLWHANLIQKLIPHSVLITVPEANHGLPYRQPQKTAQIILNTNL